MKRGLVSLSVLERLEAINGGAMPVEVMLYNMRFYYNGANDLETDIKSREWDRHNRSELMQKLEEMFRLRGLSQAAARDVAPYFHPRHGNIPQLPPPRPAAEALEENAVIIRGGLPEPGDADFPVDTSPPDEADGLKEFA